MTRGFIFGVKRYRHADWAEDLFLADRQRVVGGLE